MPNGPALGFFSIIFRKYGTTGPVIVNVVIGKPALSAAEGTMKIRRRTAECNLQRGNPCPRKPLAGIHPIISYHSPITKKRGLYQIGIGPELTRIRCPVVCRREPGPGNVV